MIARLRAWWAKFGELLELVALFLQMDDAGQVQELRTLQEQARAKRESRKR
jgi:hypothetical protein